MQAGGAVFIPAIILTEYLSPTKPHTPQRGIEDIALSFTSFIGVAVSSMLFVFLVQYLQTGKWFTFFQAQRDWSNYFRMPTFPLNSWAGGFIVRLDAMAFFFGVSAFIAMVYLIIERVRMAREKELKIGFISPPVLFSLCYLGFCPLSYSLLKAAC